MILEHRELFLLKLEVFFLMLESIYPDALILTLILNLEVLILNLEVLVVIPEN